MYFPTIVYPALNSHVTCLRRADDRSQTRMLSATQRRVTSGQQGHVMSSGAKRAVSYAW